ncbi:MAG: hypothetical protein V4472_25560 [Pseudomonadota bacterium]
MTITKVWLVRSIETVVLFAALGFVTALAAGGTAFHVSTIHAAVYAAYAAAITAVQTILAALINPPSAPPATILPTALRQRAQVSQGSGAV